MVILRNILSLFFSRFGAEYFSPLRMQGGTPRSQTLLAQSSTRVDPPASCSFQPLGCPDFFFFFSKGGSAGALSLT